MKKMNAIRARALLVSYNAMLVAMLITGRPEVPPPEGSGKVGWWVRRNSDQNRLTFAGCD